MARKGHGTSQGDALRHTVVLRAVPCPEGLAELRALGLGSVRGASPSAMWGGKCRFVIVLFTGETDDKLISCHRFPRKEQ